MSPSSALARALAPHLPGWSAEPSAYEHAGILRHDRTGCEVAVYSERVGGAGRGRVEFAACSPCYPGTRDRYSSYRSPRLSVTVSVGRPPASMALDIARRLLPAALARWDEEIQIVARETEAAKEARMVACRVADTIGADVVGAPPWGRPKPGDDIRLASTPDGVSRLTVHPAYESSCGTSGESSVSFTVSRVDPETAAEMLRVLAAAEARRAARVRVGVPAPPESAESVVDEDVSEPRRRVSHA